MVSYADRVKETSTSTGTGSISLSGAVQGYRTFSVGLGVGPTFPAVISDGTDWEVSLCHLSDTTTLVRDTVLSSSNSGALVNFGEGLKEVFCDLSSKLVQREKQHDFVDPYIYAGNAPGGSATTDPVWTIKRLTVSSAGTITATATATGVAWTSRTTATYL